MRSFAPGWRLGHWSDPGAATGCTVLLPPRGNVTSCDIRGSSPGSRELPLLHPDRRLTEVHALLLTGGSAFGLAAADGVVAWLEERGVGYATAMGPVPIVPTAVIFDLATGSARVRPGAEQGRLACDAAIEGDVASGRVGAGTGATVGKWRGGAMGSNAAAGGLGLASARSGTLAAHALAVVNAVGNVVAADGRILAGTDEVNALDPPAPPEEGGPPGGELGSTVLAVVAVESGVTKNEARWLAARGSDGITVSISPAHTRYDGDVVFGVGTGVRRAGGADLDVLGRLATDAVAGAIRDAVS